MNVEKSLAEKHYEDLSARPFFPALVDYICRWGRAAALCTGWGQENGCVCRGGGDQRGLVRRCSC